MRPHELRVVEEKAELDKKIAGLEKYIQTNDNFYRLPNEERIRMYRQNAFMRCYSRMLGARIDAFPPMTGDKPA